LKHARQGVAQAGDEQVTAVPVAQAARADMPVVGVASDHVDQGGGVPALGVQRDAGGVLGPRSS